MKVSLPQCRGAVMLEFVIIYPLFLFIFFLIIQFSQLYLVRQLLHYAAFCAARTALVYNPRDYGTVMEDANRTVSFHANRGPLYMAAVQVLSWLEKNGSSNLDGKNGEPWIPNASLDSSGEQLRNSWDGWQRVRISGKEERNAYVFITVHYYFPLLIPMAAEFLTYVLGGGEQWTDVYPPDYNSIVGAIEDYSGSNVPGAAVYRKDGIYYMHLRASCLLPKPHPTDTYARIPEGTEKNFFQLSD